MRGRGVGQKPDLRGNKGARGSVILGFARRFTLSADEQAIRRLIDDWMEASARGDLEKVLSMMSDDVVFMTPGREPFGRKEFAAQSEAMKDVKIEGVAKPIEIKVLGDWAWLRNHLTITMTPQRGQPTRRAGYVLTILNRKPDGAWVITRDANLLG